MNQNQIQLFGIKPITEPETPRVDGFNALLVPSVMSRIHKGNGEGSVFSSGSSAADWYCENCGRCAVPNGRPDKNNTIDVSLGFHCIGEYAIVAGFITGAIPESIVMHFGIDKFRCKQFKLKSK